MRGWWAQLERRFKWGVLVSTAWLVGGLGYAWGDHGWLTFWDMSPNLVGDFFAGLTAPLAFLWLVLGYMQQGEEIKETRIEIKRQADSVQANEQHARRDLFFQTANQILQELQQTALFLCVKMTGVPDWNYTAETMWNSLNAGYKDAPFHYLAQFIMRTDLGPIVGHLRPIPDVMDAVDHYCDSFEALLKSANAISPEKDTTLRDFYQNSGAARLYEQLCRICKNPRQSAMRYS